MTDPTQTAATKIGARIKALRESHNLTQEQVAVQLGWKRQKWGSIESGNTDGHYGASRHAAYREIADLFGVDPFFLREKPNQPLTSTKAMPITILKRLTALQDAGWTFERISEATEISMFDLKALHMRALSDDPWRPSISVDITNALFENTPDVSIHEDMEFVTALPIHHHMEELGEVGYGGVEQYNSASTDRDGLIVMLTSGGKDVLRRLGTYKFAATHLVRQSLATDVMALPSNVNARIPSAVGATRRLQALVAWGYDPDGLQKLLGFSDMQMHRTLYGTSVDAPLEREAGIRLVKEFSRLEHIRGKDDDAAEIAAEMGWALPFQWDEYTIDKMGSKKWNRRKDRTDKAPYEGFPEKRLENLRKEFEELIIDLGKAA
ncbi:MerR-like HTH DNA binding protein [Gordonia phage BrutonGaster]|uniref:MerR-like HTH DNA binding protein n=1 Tax=Gordonia phage BrutonGaster TaxID=2530116 RepID=A0A482JH71_9CAUD|nr:MerR-like HTH DNA binding protein [Gordonia phage BrutonGaster]QBP33298.1 MerR-like HTH DNA binding protein [Gordonia phage BrutonGaster]